LNPERQSFKCWSCGAGGDVFDFVQEYERVDFSEALRMLAERAGLALDPDRTAAPAGGPSKTELLAAAAWAEARFAEALRGSEPARAYVRNRGLNEASVARFRLGFAPEPRDWLQREARKAGIRPAALEAVGLVKRKQESSSLLLDRFRGRLIFPIHDLRGRTIGFGGRILPEAEKTWAERGLKVAKYLNSPETSLFQKRRNLYAADLARPAARQEGWVAVVEGYTDVIAAHQAGLENVVGTLGTALGDEQVAALRRLADRVVLVFDGDVAGQGAADRSLELFLAHEVDVRVLTLPAGADPCDYLLTEGADAFRALVQAAADPLDFAIDRAAERFDFDSPEGARLAAEGILAILARVPEGHRAGLELKVAKGLDKLSARLRIPVADLRRALRRLRRPARATAALGGEPPTAAGVSEKAPIRLADLDPLDRQLVALALNEPTLAPALRRQVLVDALRDAPLRAILQAIYDLDAAGEVPLFDRVTLRLDDPGLRALAAGLLLPIDPQPMSPTKVQPPPLETHFAAILAKIRARDIEDRLRDLRMAKSEANAAGNTQEYWALFAEEQRLMKQLPNSRKSQSHRSPSGNT
jgi:DNA primase